MLVPAIKVQPKNYFRFTATTLTKLLPKKPTQLNKFTILALFANMWLKFGQIMLTTRLSQQKQTYVTKIREISRNVTFVTHCGFGISHHS